MKKAVLFVDDDVNILQGMKRMLRVMRFEWNMFFAKSGDEALQILSQNHINVIVTDMRMPGMDGTELLVKVRERHPHVIRIVLSGDTNQETNLRSAKVAHQSLAKPCDADTLRSTIERPCLLQKILKNKKIAEIVGSISDLPSHPVLYNLIMKEMESPEPSLKKVGDIIAQDVAMTARVLQYVNSAFFGLPQKITLPQQAVTLLGLDIIKGLVLHAQVFSIFKDDAKSEGISVHRLWKHSVMVGTLAREIVLSESISPKIADESFVAGLLHDIGKFLLYRSPGYFQRVREYSQAKQCSYRNAEYELLGASHAEVGAYLLGLWGIPENIVEAVALHHCPGKAMDKQFSILTGVHAANGLIGKSETPYESTILSSIDLQYIRELNLESKIDQWIDCRKKVEKR